MDGSVCLHCSAPLPRAALTGRTRKFCNGRCRKAAQRARERIATQVAATVEALPTRVAEALADGTEPGERLRWLIEHRIRLNEFLRKGDEVTAQRLSKEYRETLREIDAVISGAADLNEEPVDDGGIETVRSLSIIS